MSPPPEGGAIKEQAFVYAYAVVQKVNRTGYVVTWEIVPISSSSSIDSLEVGNLNEETASERILKTLTEPSYLYALIQYSTMMTNLKGAHQRLTG